MSRELLVPETLWRFILLLLTLAAGNLAAADTAVAKDLTRVALVIGNEAYAEAPVPNAISDARAVADVLRQGGFDVVYVEDATKSGIADAVRNFAEKIDRGGVAAVYYSGHAVQHQNRNFLVAIDSKITSQGTVRSETFDMDLLLDPLIVSRPAGSVVIIDASRQNPWNRLVSNRQGLATQEPLIPPSLNTDRWNPRIRA